MKNKLVVQWSLCKMKICFKVTMFVGLNYVHKLKLWKYTYFEIEFVYLYGYRNLLFAMLSKVELMLCVYKLLYYTNLDKLELN